MGWLHRWIDRLVGRAPGERIVERAEATAQRERAKTAAVAEVTRANVTDKGPGTFSNFPPAR
jgi:hypothetical protein